MLPQLEIPTLVIHRTGDRVIPIEWGRELAAGIPGARLVELPGDDHFQYVGDVDAWMDEVERFVTGSVSPRVGFTTPSVEVLTLGRFAVIRDVEEVPISEWGSRIARQICKRLVAARGWPVTREQLIDMSSPDESDMVRLGARLSVQLSAVRRVLGGGVVADRSSVRIDLDQVASDLEAFFAADDDESIVASYAGEFLPEDAYDDWTNPIRSEARTRFVIAGHRMADRLANAGEHERVIEIARRLLDADRYDETAHRHVVESLAAMGEDAEATRAHEVWA